MLIWYVRACGRHLLWRVEISVTLTASLLCPRQHLLLLSDNQQLTNNIKTHLCSGYTPLTYFFFVCCRANVSLSQFYSQLELRCYCIMWYCQRIQPIFIDSTQFIFFHPQFNLKWKESTIELDQFRESDFTTTKWREDKRVIVCECLPSK